MAEISDNIISENKNSGILLWRALDTIIESNIIKDNLGDGMDIMHGSKATIINNTITRNDSYGILFPTWGAGIVDEPEHSTAEIRDNTISENKNTGIALWRAVDTIIKNNIIKDNGGCGIDAGSPLSIASCSGNTVSGNIEGAYCGFARRQCE